MNKKMRIFGLGNFGCSVIGRSHQPNMIGLDCDMCPLMWLRCDKIQCGKEICGGLGSGGSPDKGYLAAKETLAEKKDLFWEDENIFILGLAGGSGNGILRYILKNKTSKNQTVICAFPFDMEEKRKQKAQELLEFLIKNEHTIVLIELEKLKQEFNLNIHQIFNVATAGANKIMKLIYDGYRFSNKFVNALEDETLRSYFRTVYASLEPNFFGLQRADYEQLKVLNTYLTKEQTLLAVGCADGSELYAIKEINPSVELFGVDKDKFHVHSAKSRGLNVFELDILKGNFEDDINKVSGNEKFDVVISRNMLVYYKENTEIVARLIRLSKKFVMFGINDPIEYTIDDRYIVIAGEKLEIVDLENRIFRKCD